ncbi:MAG: hypothetical protein L0220_25765 [Acidobacteria bacterium]|nr:hypothetical protein [Acidobacteriota bacterium]
MLRRCCVLLCLLALINPVALAQEPEKAPEKKKEAAAPATSTQEQETAKGAVAPTTPDAPTLESTGNKGSLIPEGTIIQLTLRDPLSSKLNEVGDEVVATVKRDVSVDGYMLLREGTEVYGRVTLVQPARRPLKGGQLHVTFDRIRIDGEERKLAAVIQSASDFTRDEKVKSDGEGTLKAGTDGGKVFENVRNATALGGVGVTIAILSGIRSDRTTGFRGIGGGTAAASIGILGGSAVAGLLLTKGKEVRLDENAIIRLKLARALTVE